jgi:hypothetical protein
MGIDARGADGDDVGIEHHEGEPPGALQGMAPVELEDGRLLPVSAGAQNQPAMGA